MKINLKKLIEKYSEAPEDLMTAIQDWQKEQNCAPTHVSMKEFIPILFELYTQLISEQSKEKTDPEKKVEELLEWQKEALWTLRQIEDNTNVPHDVRGRAKNLRWQKEIK